MVGIHPFGAAYRLCLPPGRSSRSWAIAWFISYGAHLLCDSPLVGGKLPFLWPWMSYDFSSTHMPLGFLFGLDRWPITTLVIEAVLVIFTLWDGSRAHSKSIKSPTDMQHGAPHA